MPSEILEFFGYAPRDPSLAARTARKEKQCPFIGDTCQKTLSDGSISGACTLKLRTSGPVICCPNRLYADQHRLLDDVALAAFGKGSKIYRGSQARRSPVASGVKRIAAFGKRWGGELRLPNRGQGGRYFVDWVLAELDDSGDLHDFVAIEVQSIDTTGNYKAERLAYLAERDFNGQSSAGLNWENVNKRILPQIIYKGHVLRRESRCTKGLFFACPEPVYRKIRERLGGTLLKYGFQPGALTLMWYDIGPPKGDGQTRDLQLKGTFTTTVDQVALAFTSPSNLPDPNVYESAIRTALGI